MFQGAVVVMGVASCGKTSVGQALAEKLHAQFVEGDALHSLENVAKMSKGTPLIDEDRWPWLAKVGDSLRGDIVIVASCSALKSTYRDIIRQNAGRPVHFVHLHGDRQLLAERISTRKGHFMPASLLDSQLATLQPPMAPESFVTLNIADTVEVQVQQALAFLNERTN